MDDPPRPDVVGGQADAEEAQLHPELAEFALVHELVEWLTRGLELVDNEEPEEQRAA
jgi:hypothetical protein